MTLETIYDGDGSDVTFNTNFNYLEKEDISVAVKPSGGSYASKTLDTHYTVSGQVVTFTSGNVPPNNSKVRIRRHTPVTQPRHTFYAGSTVTAKSLNDNTNQILNALEERGLAVDDETDQPFTIGTHNEIKVNSATNLEVVAGKITNNHMAINSIDSDQYVDGSIDHVHLSNDCVDGDNISDNSIGAEHLKPDSVTSSELQADCVNGNMIQDNSINSEHYAAASIDNEHLADDAVNSAELADCAVDLSHLSASGTKNSTTFLRGDNTWHATSAIATHTSYAILKDIKSSGTDGGTLSNGDWRDRDLNNEVDPDGIVTLSNDEFTLGAGTYLLNWVAPGHDVVNHVSRIYNVTDSTAPDELMGMAACSNQTHESITHSFGVARITISGNKTFKLQHRCSGTEGTNDGMGSAFGWGPEVYDIVEIY